MSRSEHKEPAAARFRLDVENQRLWSDSRAIELTPKTFAVLRHLVGKRDRLVTKSELLDAVWPETQVGEAVLSVCVAEIRKAFGDPAATPRFVQTVHSRGYRFIGDIAAGAPTESGIPKDLRRSPKEAVRHLVAWRPAARIDPSSRPPVGLIGRKPQLLWLEEQLGAVLRGERRIVLVSGEPGIGKSALAEAFVDRAAAAGEMRVTGGQCFEQYGEGEAYMPVLDALTRLCGAPGAEPLVDVLQRYAPIWLAQIPSLASDAHGEELRHNLLSGSRERMLRQMAEFLEALTAEVPLLLVLEDLHWSDHSTVTLLSSLARRREPARLLVLGTYRPADVIVSGHPLRGLRQQLLSSRNGAELSLAPLSEGQVGEFLSQRFGGSRLPGGMTPVAHRRTDGNPLFLVHLADSIDRLGVLDATEGPAAVAQLNRVEEAIPESLREMIEVELEHLPPGLLAVLEAASVAGVDFSVASIAAALGEDSVAIESRCEALAQRGPFLRQQGICEWPDETLAGRYDFAHALYRSVIYRRLPVARCMQLHRRIGDRLELAYGARSAEIASELVVHFERAREHERVMLYSLHAARRALARHAYQEASDHAAKGLETLRAGAPTNEGPLELFLQITLGRALIATKGYAAPEVANAFARARELCTSGEPQELFQVLSGLWIYYVVRGDMAPSRQLAEQCLDLAKARGDPMLLIGGHLWVGFNAYYQGDFVTGREHAERARSLYDPQQHLSYLGLYPWDVGVAERVLASHTLWLLGFPDQAATAMEEGRALAGRLRHPYTELYVNSHAMQLCDWLRDPRACRERAEWGMRMANEYGFGFWRAHADYMRAWVLALERGTDEAVGEMRDRLTSYRAFGGDLGEPAFLAGLAQALGKAKRGDEALATIDKAQSLAESTGQGCWEAEIHRTRGELILEIHPRQKSEAEEHLRRALEIARAQNAKSLELRAVTSLARLWGRHPGKRRAARESLAQVYDWFTEGFETPDLKDARRVLADA